MTKTQFDQKLLVWLLVNIACRHPLDPTNNYNYETHPTLAFETLDYLHSLSGLMKHEMIIISQFLVLIKFTGVLPYNFCLYLSARLGSSENCKEWNLFDFQNSYVFWSSWRLQLVCTKPFSSIVSTYCPVSHFVFYRSCPFFYWALGDLFNYRPTHC